MLLPAELGFEPRLEAPKHSGRQWPGSGHSQIQTATLGDPPTARVLWSAKETLVTRGFSPVADVVQTELHRRASRGSTGVRLPTELSGGQRSVEEGTYHMRFAMILPFTATPLAALFGDSTSRRLLSQIGWVRQSLPPLPLAPPSFTVGLEQLRALHEQSSTDTSAVALVPSRANGGAPRLCPARRRRSVDARAIPMKCRYSIHLFRREP
jgi:hypothetical protein